MDASEKLIKREFLMKHILKKIGAVAGIIPVAWYCYEIQGKYMDTHTRNYQNAPTVLDNIQTAADALGLFPRTQDEMKSLVERIKFSTQERLAHILALSADERTFENTIRAYDVILNDLEKVREEIQHNYRFKSLVLDLQDIIINEKLDEPVKATKISNLLLTFSVKNLLC